MFDSETWLWIVRNARKHPWVFRLAVALQIAVLLLLCILMLAPLLWK